MDNKKSSSQNNHDLVHSALTEFRVAWLSGNKMDPDEFCNAYPTCKSELRARIEGFLNIATNKTNGSQRGSKSVLDHDINRFELGKTRSKENSAGVAKPRAFSMGKVSPEPKAKEKVPPEPDVVSETRTLQEKIEGLKRLKTFPLGHFRDAALIIAKTAQALDLAHKSGRVHGALTPSNILLEDNRVRVTGFENGIEQEILSRFQAGQLDLETSQAWNFAPEQAVPTRAGITEKTDIFALGLILYELLTLTRPFEGKSFLRTIKKVLISEPKDPSVLIDRAPHDLSRICLKALEKRTQDRFLSMGEMADCLQHFLSNEKVALKEKGISSRIQKKWGKLSAYLLLHGVTGERISGWFKSLFRGMGKPILWGNKLLTRKPAVSIATLVSICCIALTVFFVVYYPKMVQELDHKEEQNRNALFAKENEEKRNRELQEKKDQISKELERRNNDLKRSEGQRLTALSENALKTDPGLALLLAVEGAKRDYSNHAEGALMNALGQCYERKTIYHHGHVFKIAFSPDGKLLATVSDDGKANIHDVATGKRTCVFNNPQAGFCSVAFSHDGRKAAFGTQEGVITIRDVTCGVVVDTIRAHEPWAAIHSLAFSSDGRWLISGGEDGLARIWDLLTGTDQAILLKGHAKWADVHTVTFNRKQPMALTAANDKSARLWDINTGKNLFYMNGPGARVRSASFSPEGRFVLILTEDNAARAWDRDSGAKLGEFKMKNARITSAGFSPDGKWLVLTGDNGDVQVCHFFQRNNVFLLRGHSLPVTCASFSPDGEMLAIGSNDGDASLWDLKSRKKLATLKGHKSPIHSIVFSPAGDVVASAASDNTARIWNTKLSRNQGESGQLGEYIYTSASSDSLIAAMAALPRQMTYEEKELYNVWSDPERDALKIISKLNKNFIFSTDVVQALSEDESIPPNVLNHVIEFVRHKNKNQGDNLDELLKQSFSAVITPRMGFPVYRQASHIAEKALRRNPDNSLALTVLGVARYRLGAYSLALTRLNRSHTLNLASSGESWPVTQAFLSMTLHRLNKIAEGTLLFNSFAEQIQKPRQKKNPINKILLEELMVLVNLKKKIPPAPSQADQKAKDLIKDQLKKIFRESIGELDEDTKKLIQEAALEMVHEKGPKQGEKDTK